MVTSDSRSEMYMSQHLSFALCQMQSLIKKYLNESKRKKANPDSGILCSQLVLSPRPGTSRESCSANKLDELSCFPVEDFGFIDTIKCCRMHS